MSQPTHHPVTPEVTHARVLRDAALYLTRHGWIQGAYYDPAATSFTPAACTVGAIGIVCYGGPVDAPALHHDDPGWPVFDGATACLDRYLDRRHGLTAYEFNDVKGRTAGQVIAALHAAADYTEPIDQCCPQWTAAERQQPGGPILGGFGGAA